MEIALAVDAIRCKRNRQKHKDLVQLNMVYAHAGLQNSDEERIRPLVDVSLRRGHMVVRRRHHPASSHGFIRTAFATGATPQTSHNQ